MNWKKAVGLGIAFWILMFVVVSLFIAFKLYTPGQPNVVVALVAGVLAYVLAGYAKPKDQKEALRYGAVWVAVGLVLDALITLQFSSTIFQMWTLWLGYALVLVAPVVRAKKS